MSPNPQHLLFLFVFAYAGRFVSPMVLLCVCICVCFGLFYSTGTPRFPLVSVFSFLRDLLVHSLLSLSIQNNQKPQPEIQHTVFCSYPLLLLILFFLLDKSERKNPTHYFTYLHTSPPPFPSPPPPKNHPHTHTHTHNYNNRLISCKFLHDSKGISSASFILLSLSSALDTLRAA